MTATVDADAQARLDAVADAALANKLSTREAMRDFVESKVRDDADLLWEMFHYWRNPAIDALLQQAIVRRREQKAQAAAVSEVISDAAGEKAKHALHKSMTEGLRIVERTPEQKQQTRNSVAQMLWKLDVFMVNGRAIGDCTASEVRAWCATRRRDARFAELVSAGVTGNQRIRDCITREEAEEFWTQASTETADAA
jgi:hypothetical protein